MSSTSHANALYANEALIKDKEKYFRIGVPLYEASLKCDWEAARHILDLNMDTELVRYSITENGDTALHIAASANGPKLKEQFVRNLVGMMCKEDVEIVNKNQNTALYLAAAAGNTEVVWILLIKNMDLLTIPGVGGMMPLHAAAMFGHYPVVRHLIECSHGLRDDGWTDANRGSLLEKCAENYMFDIALQIVKWYPELGRSTMIFTILARNPFVFWEAKYSSLKRTFNSVSAFIGLKAESPERESDALRLLRIIWDDIVKLPKNDIDRILRGPRDSGHSGSKRFFQTLQLKNLIFKHLDELDKEIHNTIEGPEQVLQLKNLVSKHVVNIHDETQRYINENNTPEEDQPRLTQKFIFDYIVNIHDETQKSITREDQALDLKGLISNHINTMRHETNAHETFSSQVMFVAAETGNTIFITELIRRTPDLVWKVNDDNQTIFHIAVKHRHKNIYNLLHHISSLKDMVTPLRDLDENNMLHLAAKCTHIKNLEDALGPALQMQQEILWFKEVGSMIPFSYWERKNKDGQTPYELFAKEHQHLITKGEKWMKETASQCMVVAALIATIVFAAAFTVPGGYNQNDGIPMFKQNPTFVVFVVADAISLILSSASILTFLSILTSRYATRDFERSLPMKLMFGLAALFLSIGTMMVTFSVSFFVLYHKQMIWIPILISVFAITPALLYVLLQHHLLINVYHSTIRGKYVFKPTKQVLF